MLVLLVACGEPRPDARYSAVGVLDADDRGLHLVGGADVEGRRRDAWRYDLAEDRWERWPDAPQEVFRATAVRLGDDAWVFGGTTDGGRVSADLLRWSLVDGSWEVVDAGPGPGPRYKHAAVAVDGRMVVHGGHDDAGGVWSDAWAFDPLTRSWTSLGEAGSGALYRQGMALAPSGEVWVHGGLDGGFTRVDRFWSWDVEAGVWTALPAGPAERASHTVVTTASGLLVWSGHPDDTAVWTWDGAAWSAVEAPGPVARDAQVSAATSDGSAVWVYGGDPFDDLTVEFLDDLWRWDVAESRWTEVRAFRE